MGGIVAILEHSACRGINNIPIHPGSSRIQHDCPTVWLRIDYGATRLATVYQDLSKIIHDCYTITAEWPRFGAD